MFGGKEDFERKIKEKGGNRESERVGKRGGGREFSLGFRFSFFFFLLNLDYRSGKKMGIIC